jgi:uncharacterized protein YbjT (DUF2867 family)
MARVLVAGATGYVGRFVAAECKRRGDWVRALARSPEKLGRPGPCGEPAVADLVDDVFVGDVTKPETLGGLCDGVETVFSSVGITRQHDRLSYMDVDYQGNKHLLDRAAAASARRFVFVHVFNAARLHSLAVVRAKERFIGELRRSPLASSVVCPTGLFNDMAEFLGMARKGTVYLIGDGSRKINPLHGADLAGVCADALAGGPAEIPVGGPVAYTYQEIAELAFAALDSPPRVRHVPAWLANLAVAALLPFRGRYAEIAKGIVTIAQEDCVAPPTGTHTLKAFFAEMASGVVGR